MRVVHAVHSDGFAGVERYIATLSAAQVAAGHNVVVVGGGDPQAFLHALADTGVRYQAATSVPVLVEHLQRLRGADVFHAHMTAAEAAVVAAVGSRAVPLIVTRHFAAPRGKSPLGRMATPLIQRRIAAQISISQYVADHIDGPSTVVPTGVVGVPAGVRPRNRTFLVAQRLEPEKNTDTAIRAFARSGLGRSGWRLLVAGEGSLRCALEALCQELGIVEQVEFLGLREDIPRLMQTEGALIAPCAVEGLGLSALEAMAAAMPVVAAAAGGHLETVGRASRPALFLPGDVPAAAESLVSIASDEDARVEYGLELREVQQRFFTIEAQEDGVDAVYRSVIDSNGSARHLLRRG